MKDRYLYKAKRIDNGEWVQGVPFEIEGKMVILVEDNENFLRVHYIEENMWEADIYAIEVEPDTICQCTGLKDKNGKPIWENDVVSVTDEDDCSGQIDTGLGYILFLEGMWYIDRKVQNGLYDIDKSFQIEIIGNKFDNPELIEREVEMKREEQCISFAKHAIGLDNNKPYKRHGKLFYKPYRNYYDASINDCEVWEVMANNGYAERGRKDRYGGRMYWLTRKGLDWLGEKLGIKIYNEEE